MMRRASCCWRLMPAFFVLLDRTLSKTRKVRDTNSSIRLCLPNEAGSASRNENLNHFDLNRRDGPSRSPAADVRSEPIIRAGFRRRLNRDTVIGDSRHVSRRAEHTEASNSNLGTG